MVEIAKIPTKVDPFTMYLSRPEKETKPWYTDRELKRYEEKDPADEAAERRARNQSVTFVPLLASVESSCIQTSQY